MQTSLIVRLTTFGAGCKWNTENPFAPPKPRTGIKAKKSRPKSLEERRKQQITRLSGLFARLRHDPEWFGHANFDRKVQRDWSLAECREVFKRFGRFLSKTYPEAWFIWVMEESASTGFHYHFFSGPLSKRKRVRIRRKWLELTGSDNKKMIEFSRNEIWCKGYVMPGPRTKKAARTRQLINKLEGKSFWGVIGKKNMDLASKKMFVIPQEEWLAHRPTLKAALATANHGRDYSDRLDRLSGCMNFGCTRGIIKDVNEFAKHVRVGVSRDEPKGETLAEMLRELKEEVGIKVFNPRNLPS